MGARAAHFRRPQLSQGKDGVHLGHSMPCRKKIVMSENWYTMIRQEIRRILISQPTVTADDVHEGLKIPPEAMGQVAHAFRGMQMSGEIVLVEITRTIRRGQNGNRIGVWRLAA